MLRHFNSHVWEDKVCVTTTIPAKSFLLPTRQKQSGKQSPKLSAHPDGAVTPKPHLLSEALCGRKRVCTKTDRLNWQSWFSSTFFKEENRWATNGFICVWHKELYVPWACTLSPAWERAMREEVPKDTWRRVPHHAIQCKGNPNQNRTTSETDELNQDFWKLPVCKNPQETNRFVGYVKNPSYIACKWSPVQSNTWWKYGDKGAMWRKPDYASSLTMEHFHFL